jgi:alpha-methylacyl-CoA racemase
MGPIKGTRIIEMGGIGPGPMCAMMLADMGAEVLRMEQKDYAEIMGASKYDISLRGKRSLCVDLKRPEAQEFLLRLVEKADALIEGFRPGVMERLGLGPEVCLNRNPRLVYGRMTGWGQKGPLSQAAGHDINYISLTGALYCMGHKDRKPAPPLNLVGDFGGGGMLLAFGLVCALFEAQKSGQGQVVDAAMIDGVAALMGLFYGIRAAGLWSDKRQTNILDGGAPFYDTYETKDGQWISVGSLEPQFYSLLLKHTGLNDDPDFKMQMDHSKWTVNKEKLTAVFKTRTRNEWCEIMEGTDVCFAPVLSIEEAFRHPHNVSRGTFINLDGVHQPAPAPRFSRTVPQIQRPPSAARERCDIVLSEWGLTGDEIQRFKDSGVL